MIVSVELNPFQRATFAYLNIEGFVIYRKNRFVRWELPEKYKPYLIRNFGKCKNFKIEKE